MARSKTPRRKRVGHVSYYFHHGGWYIYHRADGRQIRRCMGDTEGMAEAAAAMVHAHWVAAQEGFDLAELAERLGDLPGIVSTGGGPPAEDDQGAPAIDVAQLRRQFLDHHEHVLGSTLGTIRRYAAATQHLIDFCRRQRIGSAADVPADEFVAYLRRVDVAPNGRRRSRRRKLLDKGIRYILETCRSMYRFGHRSRLIDAAVANPFSELGIGRMKIRNPKPLFVFDAAQELAFFEAADAWTLAVHSTLAKTGLRPGELTHLLIEDLDLEDAWLHVRGKPELGWSVKTGRERRVPLAPELVGLLRQVIGRRSSGPVFLRMKFNLRGTTAITENRAAMQRIAERRVASEERKLGHALSRSEQARVLRTVWRDAGAVPVDRVRSSFMRAAKAAGLEVTCPKAWRHTYATLLAEGGVDPLVRMQVMGHQPAPDRSPLGMTSHYTHTSGATVQHQIFAALELRPESLQVLRRRCLPGNVNEIHPEADLPAAHSHRRRRSTPSQQRKEA